MTFLLALEKQKYKPIKLISFYTILMNTYRGQHILNPNLVIWVDFLGVFRGGGWGGC